MDLYDLPPWAFIIVACLLVLGAVALMTVGIAYGLFLPACNELAEINQGFNIQFTFLNGCLVETDSGYWTPAENFFMVESK